MEGHTGQHENNPILTKLPPIAVKTDKCLICGLTEEQTYGQTQVHVCRYKTDKEASASVKLDGQTFDEEDVLSLCPSCNCMTKTLNYNVCGKCHHYKTEKDDATFKQITAVKEIMEACGYVWDEDAFEFNAQDGSDADDIADNVKKIVVKLDEDSAVAKPLSKEVPEKVREDPAPSMSKDEQEFEEHWNNKPDRQMFSKLDYKSGWLAARSKPFVCLTEENSRWLDWAAINFEASLLDTYSKGKLHEARIALDKIVYSGLEAKGKEVKA